MPCLLSSQRLIIPALPARACGFSVGNPSPECGGEDGTKQPPLAGSGRMGREEDDTSFGGLGLIASPHEGPNCPHWECGPFYTHAERHREGQSGVKTEKYVRNAAMKREADGAKQVSVSKEKHG